MDSGQAFENAQKFRNWKALLLCNGVRFEGIEELKTIRKNNGEVLFSLLRIEATDASGVPLLPVVMLRGHFVSVMIVLEDEDSGEEYVLLVKQVRVATGEVFYEHPAGMMDGETDTLKVAQREVEEETGISADPAQMVLLHQGMLYSSPGLLDEGGWYYAYRLRLPYRDIMAFHSRNTGDAGEHEYITTEVMPMQEAFRKVKNVHALLQLLLWKHRNV